MRIHSCTRRLIEFIPAMGKTVNLRTLRAIRVLRPLKLVSGIPSTYHSVNETTKIRITIYFTVAFLFAGRLASGSIFHIKSNGAASTNRFTGLVCNRHFCYYRFGILFGYNASKLLRYGKSM